MNRPSQRPWLRAALACAGILVAVFVFANDPQHAVLLPSCPFHTLTGLYCPGCGSTRALHQLLHGHFVAALRFNLLFVAGLPLLGMFALQQWRQRAQPPVIPTPAAPRPRWVTAGIVTLVGGIVLFGVLRNVPRYPFTLLAPPKTEHLASQK